MNNIIALLCAAGFLLFYTLTAMLLIPLALVVWVLKQVIAGIKRLQEMVA